MKVCDVGKDSKVRYGEVALRNLEVNVHDGGSTGKLVGVCRWECSVAMLFLRVSTKSERFIETISKRPILRSVD